MLFFLTGIVLFRCISYFLTPIFLECTFATNVDVLWTWLYCVILKSLTRYLIHEYCRLSKLRTSFGHLIKRSSMMFTLCMSWWILICIRSFALLRHSQMIIVRWVYDDRIMVSSGLSLKTNKHFAIYGFPRIEFWILHDVILVFTCFDDNSTSARLHIPTSFSLCYNHVRFAHRVYGTGRPGYPVY